MGSPGVRGFPAAAAAPARLVPGGRVSQGDGTALLKHRSRPLLFAWPSLHQHRSVQDTCSGQLEHKDEA